MIIIITIYAIIVTILHIIQRRALQESMKQTKQAIKIGNEIADDADKLIIVIKEIEKRLNL